MGYEVVWEPEKGTWAVFSTVTCDYVATGLTSPEQVADYIMGDDEYYFYVDEKGERHVAVAEWKTREEVEDYWSSLLAPRKVKVITRTFTGGRWFEESIDEEQRRKNVRDGMVRALDAWDAGRNRPDPKAKAELREHWVREARDVKAEGKTGIPLFGCEIGQEGLKFTGKAKYERPGPEA